MQNTEEKVEGKLQEISKLRKKIDEKDADLSQKIVNLETKRANAINPMTKELEELERDLQALAHQLKFDDGSKMIKFPIGRIFAKKQPDKIVVEDTDATIKKAEAKGYKEAVIIKKSLNNSALKTYDEKKLKSIGASTEKGVDKYYYQLDWIKTSTGLTY